MIYQKGHVEKFVIMSMIYRHLLIYSFALSLSALFCVSPFDGRRFRSQLPVRKPDTFKAAALYSMFGINLPIPRWVAVFS